MAIGSHRDRFPLVVACKGRTEAYSVDHYLNGSGLSTLNNLDDIFASIDGSPGLGRLFSEYSHDSFRFYAVKIGVETGIYCGFHW